MNRKGSGYVGSKGLLLDDCLHEIKRTRRYFDLPEPDFSLRDIERSALAKDAITALIKAIKKVHGSDVCARRNCFLEQGQNIFDDEPIGDPNWPRYRFLPSSLDWALRRTLEEAFQTIVQLPPRYPRTG